MTRLGLVLMIVATSTFITLFALDNAGPLQRNWARGSDARHLQSALEAYKARHGGYPVFPDNPVDDLKPLVAEGFLDAIPKNPGFAKSGFQYRYASGGNVFYGLLFLVEPIHWPTGIGYGGPCLQAGEGGRGKGMWGDPPACGF